MKPKRHIRYEKVQIKSVLNAVKAPSMPFEWSINPYRGCMHGCSFCYARSTHSFLGEQADDAFQNHIFVKSDAPAVLREQLLKRARSKKGLDGIGRVAIGTATDPYQPREALEQLTLGCLEVLAEFQVPTTITTRSPLILRDLDLLKRMRLISVNLSVNTLNKTVWKAFEPSTPAPEKRLEAVRHLAEEGIPAGVFLAPVMPYITDRPEDLEELLAQAASCRSQFVMSSVMRLSTPEVKLWFFGALRQYDEHLAAAYGNMYHGSGYPPSEYRAKVKETVKALLSRYRLTDHEAFQERHKTTAVKAVANPAPEQICFTF
ncbi:SPL family radical SAM protein [Paenibacillus contaminans]|nr:radical SAM protein [Paenibacillus contaminans]